MKTLLGIPLTKMDPLKYLRQLRCVVRWIHAGCRGSIEAATGVGKTWIAYIAIKKMLKKDKSRTTIVVVPTIPLKKQWEQEISDLGLLNVEVYVINTIALKNIKKTCNLLILDEVHLYAADQFSRVLSLVTYDWIMGLTATMERTDGKHTILTKRAPVVDIITQKEAIQNGWISDFIELNIAVPLNRKETEMLDGLAKKVRLYMSKFGDLEVMHGCVNPVNAKMYAQKFYPNENLDAMTKVVVGWAVQGTSSIMKRKEFLYTTERKVDLTVELIREFDFKTITFSQSTDFADKVAEALGDRAVVYHSNLESKLIMETKTKSYKTEAGANKFSILKNGKVKKTKDGYDVSWEESVKYGPARLRERAIEIFKDNRYKANVIVTAKGLDQGFNVKDVELGLDASRTANPTQHTQRTG